MVFSSHIFLFYFLPAVLIAYYGVPARYRHLTLTLFSYLFYGWSNPLFILVMVASTAIDFVCGRTIGKILSEHPGNPESLSRKRLRKRMLLVSLVSNLGLLGFFKYYHFGIDSVRYALSVAGMESPLLDFGFQVTLPLGISFYTFQSMSYTIDVYRGKVRAIDSLIDFACYVSMFPQLVAGPIIRFSDISDQLAGRTHTLEKFARGIACFSLGLAKKVLIANPCGKVADWTFSAGHLGALDAWYGALAYAFQIYFDFSGYSDMAIGLGLMLGFVFPKNFDSPYRSASITEFWRRWHISLSTWLRDYLYFSLGGNRGSQQRTYLNVGIVMLLGGLWHGAAWNFIAWGAVHGLFLSFERAMGKRPIYQGLPRNLKIAVTFVLVLLTWVLFRAEDIFHAMRYFQFMFGLVSVSENAALLKGILYQPYYLITLTAAVGITAFCPQSGEWTLRVNGIKMAACLFLFWISVAVLTTQAYNPFIYFIF